MICRGIAMWAHVQNPDVRYDPSWKITVLLSDEEAKRLKTAGIKVRRNDDDVFVIKINRRVNRRKGNGKNEPPEVVDASMEPFTQLIGNGSEVIVQFGVYQWNNEWGKGVGLDLQKVQVITHVPYEPASGGSVVDEEVIQPITSSVKAGRTEDF